MSETTMSDNCTTTFPVHGQDIFNYLAGEFGSDCQMHLVIQFDTQLDEEIVQEATYQVTQAVPILGCRFIEDGIKACFSMPTPIGKNIFFDMLQTETTENDIREFIAAPPESLHSNLWHVRLFRARTNDILCIKLNHTCSDAAGLLKIYHLLAASYTRLSKGTTEPVQATYTDRAAIPFLHNLGIEDPRQAWKPQPPIKDDSMVFPHKGNRNLVPSFCTKLLPSATFKKMKTYGITHGATINDLLLTAFYRALFKITECENNHVGRISVSIDLRSQMPSHEHRIAANTSAAFTAATEYIEHETFQDTLQRVSSMMSDLKKTHAEIPIAAIMETFGLMPFSAVRQMMASMREIALDNKFVSITLSNVGKITPEIFADSSPVDAYFIGPAMFTPGLMLTASGYADTLMLAVNYFSSDIEEDIVQILLNEIAYDLETCI